MGSKFQSTEQQILLIVVPRALRCSVVLYSSFQLNFQVPVGEFASEFFWVGYINELCHIISIIMYQYYHELS